MPVIDQSAGDRLRASVRADFGIELTSIDRTGYGADVAAELWRAAAADGTRYAVKLSGAGSSAAVVVPSHLAERGVAGVVAPERTRDGRLWSEQDGRRLTVVPWVSDHRALTDGMTAAQWRAYGALLARVHATGLTGPLVTLPREEHTHDRLVARTRTLDRRLRALLDEGADEDRGTDELARTMAREWYAAAELIDALLARADALGRVLRDRPASTVLCHADAHLGNLLLGPGDQLWLIDWDDAVLAAPERDLIFAIGGVIDARPVTAEQESWFFDGYGPVRVDADRLAYYRLVRTLDDLVYSTVQVIEVSQFSEAHRADELSLLRAMLSSTGLVRRALASVPTR